MIKKMVMLIGCLLFGQLSWANQVSVSNYPLYLLSQAVTQGKGDAKILLKAGDVGHHGSLSPSSVKLVQDSQFVVWFGGTLEQNLVKPLKNAPNAIALFDFNAFYRQPLRDVDGHAIEGSFDPHIWLSPKNAKAIVAALTVIHSHANPQFQAHYQANAQAFFTQMDKLSAKYRLVQPQPYWAYHDAYQYLEPALNLKFAGALTPDHHLSPKASRFRVLNATRPKATMCLASQMSVSDGIKTHLGNVRTVVRQEDMSDGDDFLAVWEDFAKAMIDCVQ